MAKNEPREKVRVLTGKEAEEVRAALEYEQGHADELEQKDLRRQLEFSKYPLSDYEGKKQPPLPPKRKK